MQKRTDLTQCDFQGNTRRPLFASPYPEFNPFLFPLQCQKSNLNLSRVTQNIVQVVSLVMLKAFTFQGILMSTEDPYRGSADSEKQRGSYKGHIKVFKGPYCTVSVERVLEKASVLLGYSEDH